VLNSQLLYIWCLVRGKVLKDAGAAADDEVSLMCGEVRDLVGDDLGDNDLRRVAGGFTQRRILQARLRVWVRNEGILILETYNEV
jgi:hypothetical protein